MNHLIVNKGNQFGHGKYPYLFWSERDGWVNPNTSSVTIFSEREKPDTMPDDGQWIDIDDAWMYL